MIKSLDLKKLFRTLLIITFSFLIGYDFHKRYPEENLNKYYAVHDFVWKNSETLCNKHSGVHYIIPMTEIYKKNSDPRDDFSDYPCKDLFKVRCHDGYLTTYDTETKHCFIQVIQIKESGLQ